MSPDAPSNPLIEAREILAAYDELTRQLKAELLMIHARARDLEDEVDRAGAEVARRGARLRALGETIECTKWDAPSVSTTRRG